MGYHNIFAQQQLMEVRDGLVKEVSAIEFSAEDDELDQELKYGSRGALEFAIGVVDEKIMRLRNEQK